ncbi:MAG TPA: TetR/AcrR family transcriptional regulator [Acidimicrobiales bacterium]
MGRPAKFTDADLVGAVGRIVAADGPGAVTIRTVAAEAGAPVGSIYHRFASRELLVATAWVAAVQDFQAGYLAALTHPDVDEAARGAARHVPLWAGAHPEGAALLLRHSRAELVGRWPDELDDVLRDLNRPLLAALRAHAKARYGRSGQAELRHVRYALVHVPGAAVRATPRPATLADAVVDAALAALRAHTPAR